MSIPKIIHWCWFGPNELSPVSSKCIESWSNHCPDFKIKKWSEEDIKVIDSKFLTQALKNKQWAFASDYVRLYALYNEGGVYLDTDMELIKSLNFFLDSDMFIGKEDDVHISAGIIGSKAHLPLVREILDYYDSGDMVGKFVNIPRVLTKLIDECSENIEIYDQSYFYPYNPNDKNSLPLLMYNSISENTYAIHHWERKWKLGLINKIKRKLFV
ncbi:MULTISPECIES: glycosyltransferase family 32 protein [Vibrio harveyi group]|uniref:glycosyltransferase family 32 protein n=1 Tax=Vibrio harveyi group TaxID=717610 RepID=UPI00082515FC|nr:MULTISPECIES: glycosyltransferase [Vibrio harveyi group]EHH2506033.1 hypothetical protein [Vibrio parahaemolyticus]EIZ1328122.1 hypothetical protein [Vibrio parahaemolyticus]EJB5623032.1 hypothetical protein [Vibrio parahaemolyticus]EJC6730398.1 hypothetical protein [Vibrio parahaemolyticus]EJC6943596.1 hypothetical protein [Vibrio parahaemolyticus]